MKPRLTDRGFEAHRAALKGKAIKFSKIKMGNGALPGDYHVIQDLMNPVADIGFTSYSIEDDYVLLQGTYDNSTLTNSFYWKEVGIFIVDPDDSSSEILYAYGHIDLEEDEAAANIPKYSKETYEIKLTYRIYMGESAEMASAVISSAVYVTRGDFDAHLRDFKNPHKVTKEQVNLGNVENVAVNDMTPSITEARTLAKLINGERLTTLMGKIAKAVAELITHITDVKKHVSDAERTSWNAKAAGSHTHTTANITSGTFSIARGGTGCGTEAELKALIRRYASSTEVIYEQAMMNATGWDGNTYSFESSYPSSQKHLEISLSPEATGEEYRAFVAARMTGSATGNIVTALGRVPEINIPVYLTVAER